MAQAAASPAEMISQLEAARKLVLGDALFYAQIVPGILPIIGPTAALEIRRWGAEFLAETFASPSLGYPQKEELSLVVLPVLRGMLEIPGEDDAVLKSVVQTIASVYALVFKKCISRPEASSTWQIMAAVKSNILKRMDTAPPGLRVCCIKFVQKVVQVQTPGLIADPRRPEQNETSIALVPRNHPFLSLPSLEAEASGLLDRLLSVFQENTNDPILIDATLNCLGILVRTRPAIANKVISAILNFNPLKQANSAMTPRLRVVVKSMERTTRALLKNIIKNSPNGPLAAKIDAYLVRLNQSRSTIFADAQSLKRSAPSEPTDGLDDAKRARLTGATPRKYPHMPPPPNSVAQLFTLTDEAGLIAFDAKILPMDMINTITSLTLQHVDQPALEEAIGVIRARYTHLQKMQQPTPVPDVPMAGPTGIDDEDDYDPEYDPAPETISVPIATQALPELVEPGIALGPFELPKPPPLTSAEVAILSKQTVEHFHKVIDTLALSTLPSSRQKLGLNRLAASTNDRDAWVTMMTRLATRAPSGLDELASSDRESDDEDEGRGKSEEKAMAWEQQPFAEGIRTALYSYVGDFRSRLNVAISWLNEEWYADKMHSRSKSDSTDLPNYNLWTLRFLDLMLPYLDNRDNKLLIRFLSEIPAINTDILERVKSLARDPERVNMCMMAMQYLILMRPPVRTMVIDTIEQIWRDDDFQETRASAAKVLAKWRPGVLGEGKQDAGSKQEPQAADAKVAAVNGVKREDHGPLKGFMVDPRKKSSSNAPVIMPVGENPG